MLPGLQPTVSRGSWKRERAIETDQKLVMKSFIDTGTFNAEFVATIDAKLAIWHSLLPSVKRDPLRQDGSVDEVMFLAHLMATM